MEHPPTDPFDDDEMLLGEVDDLDPSIEEQLEAELDDDEDI